MTQRSGRSALVQPPPPLPLLAALVLLLQLSACPATLVRPFLQRRGSSAVLDRAPLTAEQQSALNKLAAGGGLYRLRLPSAGGGSPPVAASFPVHCLAASASDGGLALDLLDGGHVAGIALNAPCGQRIAAELQLPASQAVAVRLPTAAPEVLPQLVPGQVAGDAAAGLGGVGLQQDAAGGAAGAAGAAGQQAAGEGRGTGQQGGGKGKPQPDERTWLQKNWMLVMPLGFIVSWAGGLKMFAGCREVCVSWQPLFTGPAVVETLLCHGDQLAAACECWL